MMGLLFLDFNLISLNNLTFISCHFPLILNNKWETEIARFTIFNENFLSGYRPNRAIFLSNPPFFNDKQQNDQNQNDRASIVGDAINYIQELLREVKELKLLVEKKRSSRERSKRVRTAEEIEQGGGSGGGGGGGGGGGAWDVESSNAKGGEGVVEDQRYNLRSSWLQRKTKDTEVDVRIVDDEVTVKLVQRKLNCLLLVSKLLEDLQLDLHHVAGGHIGDYYSFLFNTKVYKNSSHFLIFPFLDHKKNYIYN